MNTNDIQADTVDVAHVEPTLPANEPVEPKVKVKRLGPVNQAKRDAHKAGGTAKRVAKVKAATAAKAAKADVCPYLGSYPKLKHWPAKAGNAPDRDGIMAARALLGSPRSAGSKRELAIAAYLRVDSGAYHVGLIADALQRVVGGSFNPLLNVINADVERNMGLGKCIKAKVDGGTSYRLELNAKGKARVARYMAAMGQVDRAPELTPQAAVAAVHAHATA